MSTHSIHLFLLLLASATGATSATAPFDFAAVQDRARTLAAAPYATAADPLPASLARLDYVGYREIEFRFDRAWWTDETIPFRITAFHRGGLYHDRVLLHEVTPAGAVVELEFDASRFNYRALGKLPDLPADLGYAGWRLLHPVNRPGQWDEVAAFVGASYFRCVPRGLVYGLSARGLALDSGLPDRAEEFPRFREFWLARPGTQDAAARVWALLDSPRVTGAYAFTLRPGNPMRVDVDAVLYFRSAVPEAGWAPLTSMFWFGEQDPRPAGETRPEVHDSDLLWVRAAGAADTWLPLQAVDRPTATEIRAEHLLAFGLLQQDRAFDHYQDNEAHYDRRPSAWVEPGIGWGSGRVRVVQLPAEREYADNVVAYWVPDQVNPELKPVPFSYTLWWGENPAPASSSSP